jgi:hypothetical protein
VGKRRAFAVGGLIWAVAALAIAALLSVHLTGTGPPIACTSADLYNEPGRETFASNG